MATVTITNNKSKKMLRQLQREFLSAKARYAVSLAKVKEFDATLDFANDFDAAFDTSEDYSDSIHHHETFTAFWKAGDDLLAEARNFSEGFPRCFQKDIATAFDAAKQRHDIREKLLDLCVRV